MQTQYQMVAAAKIGVAARMQTQYQMVAAVKIDVAARMQAQYQMVAAVKIDVAARMQAQYQMVAAAVAKAADASAYVENISHFRGGVSKAEAFCHQLFIGGRIIKYNR